MRTGVVKRHRGQLQSSVLGLLAQIMASYSKPKSLGFGLPNIRHIPCNSVPPPRYVRNESSFAIYEGAPLRTHFAAARESRPRSISVGRDEVLDSSRAIPTSRSVRTRVRLTQAAGSRAPPSRLTCPSRGDVVERRRSVRGMPEGTGIVKHILQT